MSSQNVLVFGEALADVFPEHIVLGGAPFNVARHLAQLGIPTHLASAIGKDELGSAILAACLEAGVDSQFISESASLLTGRVLVSMQLGGQHQFEIEKLSAWDNIEFPGAEPLQNLNPQVLVYGTLALREKNNRNVLLNIMQHVDCLRVCDFNWRAGHISIDTAIEFARMADWVKLSDEELVLVADALGAKTSNPEQVRELLGVGRLLVTYGEQGSLCIDPHQQLHSPAFKAQHFIDSVGAGDSFLAALLAAYLYKRPLKDSLNFAARFAASICEVRGAVPSDKTHYQLYLDELQQ